MALKQSLLLSALILIQIQGIASPKSDAIKLAKELYLDHPFTFFCEKPIEDDGTIYSRKCDICPMQPIKVKWMDIIPAKRLAQDRDCYNEKICYDKLGKAFKGLLCCRQIDDLFNEMETDLHNIVPEEPMLNVLNRQCHMGRVEKSVGQYVCDLRHDFKHKTIQPPPQSAGVVARTYLYYESKYPIKLSDEEKQTFLEWHYAFPPDAWEKERNTQIYAMTGKFNTWAN